MKKKFSIGEVAELLGISVQTLRFYCNNGLIEPAYVKPGSGYRYFAYEQLHIIDRIKYLQGLGFSLAKIKGAISSGQVEDLLPFLEEHRDKALAEMERARSVAESLQWYINYYSYLGDNHFPAVPFKKTRQPAWAIGVKMFPGEALFGPGGYRLEMVKRDRVFQNVEFLRQVGYVLDYGALAKGVIQPDSYFVYLKNKPDFEHEAIIEIPGGEFLCFRGRILSDDWDASQTLEYFKERPGPGIIVADEYEDNMREFTYCTYEVQMLL
ncbi:helix-turn-helix domain-containing protein [Desulfovibrio sp. OttesenSCG-928-C06]|nr:helix-turn-helix domain-containing protein [Desulfovibrio sp. OttesenSCG-928-C06]